GPGPGTSTNQPPQPFFAPQGLPPGYPPPHFGHGNPMQPGVMGHVPPPAQQGHSPPPHNFKDERTQRQYIKLKKKLEQKQMRGDGLSITSSQATPPISPRKELVNGMRRGKDRGMSSVGTSEDGEESSSMQDEEDEVHLITEMLSTIKSPQVAELNSRSALLQWSPPERLTEAASLEGKNPEFEISEADLRYEVLLSDKGKEGKYKSIYGGIALSCRIQDLRPGTEYSVCLQVHFEELQGSATEPTTFTTPPCEPDQPQPPKLISRTRTSLQLSCYSDIVQFSTSGSPPSQPAVPVLKEASITSLHVAWQRRPVDDDFTLQMDNKESGHGFLPVYNGKETHYVCEGLRRHTEYWFRLRAHNEEGTSKWSEEVCYRTLPDRPAAPPRPTVKGRIHAQTFKMKWEPPSDRGGADITTYILEVDGGSGFETVYTGSETECICDRLTPGTTYVLRVSCISAGGRSNYSDPCIVTTEAVCPGKCSPPRLHGKPRATTLALKWSYPEYDGGAPLTEFEVEMTCPNASRQQAYMGKDTECIVTDLSPGQTYVFQVRAFNRVGYGPWSDCLEITSGAAPPDTPREPQVTCRSSHLAIVQWEEPASNGAPITDYRLEMSIADREQDYNTASNSAGWSPLSPISHAITPPSSPATVSLPRYSAKPTSLKLLRVQAVNNVGPGSFSPVLRAATAPLPPAPPKIECAGVGHNYLKLKWGDGKNPNFTQYALECDNTWTKEFQCVYQAPKVSDIQQRNCWVEWNTCKPIGNDPVIYQIQLSRLRDQEYKQVYRGAETKVHLNDLEAGADYNVRVCPVRQTSTGDLPGAYSPPATFSTLMPEPVTTTSTRTAVMQVTERKPLTDQQWAMIILCVFTLFAILTAVVMQQVIHWSKESP
ncbi:hypothetical protein C0J52_17774, partial [Blattella germanica]